MQYRGGGKRWFDVLLAIPLVILTLPLQAVIAILVRVRLGTPVLFRQYRPGRDARPFEMVKYRTMTNCRDEDGELQADGQRLTRFGAFLRSTSLDELPELYNVIRGDMSLVGPRPLLMTYLNRYTDSQARRHDVRPGITGWAQVKGRNRISWEEKFEQDVYYVDNVSLRLDLKIIVLTAINVLKRADTSADNHATAPEFLGSSHSDD